MIHLSTRSDLQPISVGLRRSNLPVVVFLFAQRVFLQGIDLSGVQK